MRNRIFLGALYYYFWSIPFFFTSDPVGAYVFAGVLGVLATVLTFEIGRRVAGAWAGVVSALLFATTPLAVIDGRMAWAPATLPVASGAILLSVVVLLERGSVVAAVCACALTALALQLHIAVAPIALVVGVAMVSQAGRLGVSGLVAAAATAAVVLLPQLWALGVPPPASEAGPSISVDLVGGRIADLVAVGRDAVAGLSAAPSDWPGWVDAWLGLEVAWIGLVTLCAAAMLVGLSASAQPTGALAVLGTLASVWLTVAFLPVETWYYYLDASLVPAALVVGIVFATLLGRPGSWAVFSIAMARTAFVFWWIHTAHASGVVPANLDLLRLGGPAGDWDARARIPTVAARHQAADALVGRLGFTPPDIWARAHGPGFSDLDTDNGYAFRRAFDSRVPDAPSKPASHAVVTYRGQVPDDWWADAGAPIIAGPFEILTYEPSLAYDRARLLGCGGGSPPSRPVTEPLDYGDGALRRPQWPCSRPTVSIPLEERGSREDTLRVFARLDGAGRILDLDTLPPGRARSVDGTPAAFGRGVLVRGAQAIVVSLEVDGPASLDVFELRGR